MNTAHHSKHSPSGTIMKTVLRGAAKHQRIPVTVWAMCMVFTIVLSLPVTAYCSTNSHSLPVWWADMQNDADKTGYNLLSTLAPQSLPESALLIDVRPDYEFAAGHIEDAVNFEFHPGDVDGIDPSREEAFRILAGEDKGRMLVFYCRSFR